MSKFVCKSCKDPDALPMCSNCADFIENQIRTKAEERLIKAIVENSNIIYSDYGASLLEAVRKERKKK